VDEEGMTMRERRLLLAALAERMLRSSVLSGLVVVASVLRGRAARRQRS